MGAALSKAKMRLSTTRGLARAAIAAACLSAASSAYAAAPATPDLSGMWWANSYSPSMKSYLVGGGDIPLNDAGKKMAADYAMDYLGALPLDIKIRLQADSGKPTVVADPDGEIAGIYKAVARQVAIKIAAKAKDFSSKFPSIKISKDT